MRTLVIGDVHGCARELGILLHEVGPDRAVLVGDLFTKGPDPVGVWRLIREHRLEAVLGNHDDALLRAADGRGSAGHRRVARWLEAEDPGWRPWLSARPLFLEVAGFTVVHGGLHPSGELSRTTRDMALTLRRWPRESEDCPHWHRVYRGARRVIFGHDARGGLVRVERDGQPWLIGLDTGCVYGGALSGYVVEDDRLVQVPAARVYRPVG